MTLKNKKLKLSNFIFSGLVVLFRGLKASPVAWTSFMENCIFWSVKDEGKNFTSIVFLTCCHQIPDTDRNSPEMLDPDSYPDPDLYPDPDSMNADPQHCLIRYFYQRHPSTCHLCLIYVLSSTKNESRNAWIGSMLDLGWSTCAGQRTRVIAWMPLMLQCRIIHL